MISAGADCGSTDMLLICEGAAPEAFLVLLLIVGGYFTLHGISMLTIFVLVQGPYFSPCLCRASYSLAQHSPASGMAALHNGLLQ